jgi:hypothetical protein
MRKLQSFSAISVALLLSAFFAFPVRAAEPIYPFGTLVKASGNAVYAIGGDGNRYAFPNERIFKSWFKDFSNVKHISDDDLATMTLAGNVTYKPGVKLIKVATDPKVYAVGAEKTLRWLKTESVARDCYGVSWAKNVDDVSDVFFSDYQIGAPISAKGDYDPSWEVYANMAIVAVTGGPTSNDPSTLPRDIPRYPGASFAAVSISVTGNDAVAELTTSDSAATVQRWYEAIAPKFGWTKRESLAQAVFGTGKKMSISFRKSDSGMTYDFSVTMLDTGVLTLYRTPTVPDPGFDGFPASIPIYRGGEILYVKSNAASSTAEYVVLTSAKPEEVIDALTSDLTGNGWAEIDVKDVGTALIRKYERMEGRKLMNLLVVIGEVTGVERNATAVIVRYGPTTVISAVDLDQLKSLFKK